jgi:hypothetical protein
MGRTIVCKSDRRAVRDNSDTPSLRAVESHPLPTESHPPAPVITLYRSPDDPWADEIQEALDEMVIAYETETIADGATPPDDIPDLPALRDEGKIVTGEAPLRAHLDDLRDLMADWNRFQSDACYIEDDGTIC